MSTTALQDEFAPHNACFGCGPTNEQGLQLKSFVDGDEVIAEWTPQAHHLAFENVLNGGICGALLDCHSNWTASHALMVDRGTDRPPTCVTADFHVKLKRPTPMDGPVQLRASAVEINGDRVIVEATLEAGGKVTATCRGMFVAVREGHPAFGSW